MKTKFTLVFAAVTLLMAGLAYSQVHFNPCTGGDASQAMTILIIDASYDGTDLTTGDEIGIYGESDTTLCLGAKAITGTVSESSPLVMTIKKNNGGNCGFVVGDSIIYKVWVSSESDSFTLKTKKDVQYYDTETQDPIDPVLFSSLGTAVVALKGGNVKLTMQASPVSGGTTVPAAGVYVFDVGSDTVVNIQANPATGYRFDGWTGDVADPNSASTTVTMDGDKDVTANFMREFTLTVALTPVGGGTIDPGLGVHTYDSSAVVNLTATPASGYVFDNWTGDVADPNSANTSVTMDDDKSITGNFEQDVVPVELVSFSADFVSEESKVLLQWRTASEMNNYGFSIERKRSDQASAWEEIGFVDGHGTTNVPHSYSFVDESYGDKGVCFYRLKQLDTDGSYEYSGELEVRIGQMEGYRLAQNYPNPFNPKTNIRFNLSQSGDVRLDLLNVRGEVVMELARGHFISGQHEVALDAQSLPSGMYLYRLRIGDFVSVRKMALLR
ncbi:MAG: T9SS type A sorting domain-containing protein [candidate division KSB1 bacterium]|jgi:uncharacterized repeat protein (TIGR02543 family)|nr:T9SS type A sorting domain-containing protein [candidate division KSB1 bacterium]